MNQHLGICPLATGHTTHHQFYESVMNFPLITNQLAYQLVFQDLATISIRIQNLQSELDLNCCRYNALVVQPCEPNFCNVIFASKDPF